jgi:hypothetical protein
MADTEEFKQYELTDEDIEKVINYLKIVDPENATPENAISFLEQYAVKFHLLGHMLSDADLRELYEKFKNNDLSD